MKTNAEHSRREFLTATAAGSLAALSLPELAQAEERGYAGGLPTNVLPDNVKPVPAELATELSRVRKWTSAANADNQINARLLLATRGKLVLQKGASDGECRENETLTSGGLSYFSEGDRLAVEGAMAGDREDLVQLTPNRGGPMAGYPIQPPYVMRVFQYHIPQGVEPVVAYMNVKYRLFELLETEVFSLPREVRLVNGVSLCTVPQSSVVTFSGRQSQIERLAEIFMDGKVFADRPVLDPNAFDKVGIPFLSPEVMRQIKITPYQDNDGGEVYSPKPIADVLKRLAQPVLSNLSGVTLSTAIEGLKKVCGFDVDLQIGDKQVGERNRVHTGFPPSAEELEKPLDLPFMCCRLSTLLNQLFYMKDYRWTVGSGGSKLILGYPADFFYEGLDAEHKVPVGMSSHSVGTLVDSLGRSFGPTMAAYDKRHGRYFEISGGKLKAKMLHPMFHEAIAKAFHHIAEAQKSDSKLEWIDPNKYYAWKKRQK